MELRRGHYLAGGCLAVAAVIMGWQWYTAGSSPLPNRIKLVCVETGKMYSMGRSELQTVPAKNPDTGKSTLVPCVEEDGVVRADDSYRQAVIELGEVNRYVDSETLEIKPSS